MRRGGQSNRLQRQRSSVVKLRAKRRLLGKSPSICTMDVECCAIVVVHRYDGAMFVVPTILWCSIRCGVWGVFSRKWSVFNNTQILCISISSYEESTGNIALGTTCKVHITLFTFRQTRTDTHTQK